MNITFYGSTIFSLEILKKLFDFHKSGKINLLYVISQPAKPFGRKKELKNNVVAEFCIENSIKLFTPNKIKELKDLIGIPSQVEDDSSANPLENTSTDLSIVAAYGKILPQWLLNTSKYGFLNFHGSLLPKYRGATPVQTLILNQDSENVGVTIQKMKLEMDEGDIVMKLKVSAFAKGFGGPAYGWEGSKFKVGENTSGELMIKLAQLSADFVEKNIDYLLEPNDWKLEKQDSSLATYCSIDDFSKEKMQINYADGIDFAHGKIMAANPEPLASLKCSVQSLELSFNLLRSRIIEEQPKLQKQNDLNLQFDRESKKLFLELNDGFLEILELQPFGKNMMDGKSFANGYLTR